MTAREFVYWLQGFYEVNRPDSLSIKQVELIKRHLRMVFLHEIDPSYPAEQQDALARAHQGVTGPTGYPISVRGTGPIEEPVTCVPSSSHIVAMC